MRTTNQAVERVLELRQDFDRGFATAPVSEHAASQDFLAIRLGQKHFALRLSDIACLLADKTIVRVPGAEAALLGIAGFRGTVAPVYDLQRLLGDAGAQAPRWLVVAAAASVAFAFEAFDGRLRVSPSAIRTQTADTAHGFSKSVLQTESVVRPIIELSSVLGAIKT